MVLHTGFKTFENKHTYDNVAYKKFITDLHNGDAVWAEFLPTPLHRTTETVLVRTKLVGAEEYETMNLPNSRLYMLKNEIRFGCQYGFAYTDFFNAMKTISHTKKWFSEENDFKVYGVNIEGQDKLRVIDFTYSTKEEYQSFIGQLLRIATLFGHTNRLMVRWQNSMYQKPKLQKVMNSFNIYSKTFLLLNGVNPKTYEEGEGRTQYHFFNVIEKSDSFADFKRRLSVYNIGFEQMASGFEAFYGTFNHNSNFNAEQPKVINDLSRNIYIG